jgi:hypothetical protein
MILKGRDYLWYLADPEDVLNTHSVCRTSIQQPFDMTANYEIRKRMAQLCIYV